MNPSESNSPQEGVGKYFSSFWNVLELSKVVVCIASIVMYALKTAYVKYSLKDLAAREGILILHILCLSFSGME